MVTTPLHHRCKAELNGCVGAAGEDNITSGWISMGNPDWECSDSPHIVENYAQMARQLVAKAGPTRMAI